MNKVHQTVHINMIARKASPRNIGVYYLYNYEKRRNNRPTFSASSRSY